VFCVVCGDVCGYDKLPQLWSSQLHNNVDFAHMPYQLTHIFPHTCMDYAGAQKKLLRNVVERPDAQHQSAV
jgi:hypothetical protein